MSSPARTGSSKHREVFETLLEEIREGRWKEGDRLPSEAMLTERFGHSRITIGRALRDLQSAGLIRRRAGSGSYVASTRTEGASRSFGILIADLGEADIYEAICRGMMAAPQAERQAFLWGSAPDDIAPGDVERRGARAWQLCQQYIERRVDGVFFAPVSMSPAPEDVNHRIVRALDGANIPVVLLDRAVTPYPDPGHHDLVGIDNRLAGHIMTQHLLQRGATRVMFVGRPESAPTVDARESGYRRAATAAAVEPRVARIDPADQGAVGAMLAQHRPDGIVCANDRTAAKLMQSLLKLGVRIPHDVRLAGIDDMDYASLLPVPLTTYRQPARQIGQVALSVMLGRVADRELPAMDIRLRCELVVRESCGGA